MNKRKKHVNRKVNNKKKSKFITFLTSLILITVLSFSAIYTYNYATKTVFAVDNEMALELEELQASVLELEQELKNYESEVASLNVQITELENNIAKNIKNLNVLETELVLKNDAIVVLESELSDKQLELDFYITVAEHLESELDAKQSLLLDLEEELDVLMENNNLNIAEIENLTTQINNLNEDIDVLSNEITIYNNTIDSLNLEIANKNNEINLLVSEKESLELNISDLTIENNSLNDSLDNLTYEIDAIYSILRNLANSYLELFDYDAYQDHRLVNFSNAVRNLKSRYSILSLNALSYYEDYYFVNVRNNFLGEVRNEQYIINHASIGKYDSKILVEDLYLGIRLNFEFNEDNELIVYGEKGYSDIIGFDVSYITADGYWDSIGYYTFDGNLIHLQIPENARFIEITIQEPYVVSSEGFELSFSGLSNETFLISPGYGDVSVINPSHELGNVYLGINHIKNGSEFLLYTSSLHFEEYYDFEIELYDIYGQRVAHDVMTANIIYITDYIDPLNIFHDLSRIEIYVQHTGA